MGSTSEIGRPVVGQLVGASKHEASAPYAGQVVSIPSIGRRFCLVVRTEDGDFILTLDDGETAGTYYPTCREAKRGLERHRSRAGFFNTGE